MDITKSIDNSPILIIGANVRFLAENAIRHNHNIHTIDYYGDWDLQKLCPNTSVKHDGDGAFELRSLINLAGGIDNCGVVYCAGFENDVLALSRLQKLGHVYGCDLEAVRRARDPEFIKRASDSWSFKYPEVRYQHGADMKNGQWLIKPFAETGGVNLRFADAGLDAGDKFFFQKYVPGLHSSASFISNGADSTLLGVTTQIIGDESFGSSGFRFVGNVFPHPFSREVTEKVTQMAEALSLELGLRGLWGFDFIYDGDVTLIEINPRPTAALGVLAQATWNDFLDIHVAGCIDENKSHIIDPGPTGQYVAQARVFAKEDAIFQNPEKWYDRGEGYPP
ncbi:hypothetical protein MNBD_NITROSPINAE02-1361 [hydrothermal vent metagenome]|uniref:ATP-grasp domain-containing protein n=1 Tax=hydrothermal vent metagenome TaxID=652676 RepID=A0A3B1DBZ8_9ZZZZ